MATGTSTKAYFHACETKTLAGATQGNPVDGSTLPASRSMKAQRRAAVAGLTMASQTSVVVEAGVMAAAWSAQKRRRNAAETPSRDGTGDAEVAVDAG